MNPTIFKHKKYKDIWIDFIILCALLLLYAYIFIQISRSLFYDVNIGLWLFVIVVSFIIITHIRIIKNKLEYTKVDKNKTIVLDNDTLEALVYANGNVVEIKKSNISKVALFDSWEMGVMPYFSYFEIHLKDTRKIIITHRTASINDFSKLLKGKKRTTQTSWIPCIKKRHNDFI
ncbi:hypothetical protein ACFO3O_07700 [Dokdonia ponticola]|uniref:PH domain-containing protein n=1 Tax=Dokdonia ponticola TaxID=2041041 RepID=A0ABV9HWB0_9FLAO